ncbi:MAG: depupylase/deamidase Dop [Actinomycetaceae bacterium]|nr:proteasome accessory factor PafA2 [Arcanobacterium sp.]MDD7686534.1 depupylase/deamidase Dop [Actinomycetaceae bacterium]MDY5272814.1 depupylase/deamidase Dop [Arcanobacterium sp.]
MSVQRVIGMETEFGITDPTNPRANVLALCAQIVNAYGVAGSASANGRAIPWDYKGESPLNDARGFRISRAEAHPSLLTDDPEHPAPSGESSPVADKLDVTNVRRPSAAELALPKSPNAVLTNGARFYVDHAHPEYSAPEVASPWEAVLWDRAGEAIAQEAMDIAHQQGLSIVLYKNNVDGKGSAYGTHENYLVERSVPFDQIIRVLTPFFVTRPIVCGAGRVGIGKKSEQAGFQISQRADYVENDVGIETTFDRPIINTRDEPHADERRYRRLHVIGGDANQFDVSNFLKVGTTTLVLSAMERGLGAESEQMLARAALSDPVTATWAVSHDPHLRTTVETVQGEQLTALDIQYLYLDAVRATYQQKEEPDSATEQVLSVWQQVLDGLRHDVWSVATRVEWVAKWQMLESLRARNSLSWENDKLRAFDVQWHDLRPERSIVNRLDHAGRVERLVSPAQVLWASTHAPESTRAYMRGGLIRKFPQAVATATWEAVTLDVPGQRDWVRIPLMHPDRGTRALVGDLLEGATTVEDFLGRLGAVSPEN